MSGERLPLHDRGKVLVQAMFMLAGGGEACSDIEHLRSQPALFAEDLVYWAAQQAATADLRESLQIDDDRLSSAVKAAAAAGVIIAAAAGNDADHFVVPAAMPDTIAAGFTRIRTELDDGLETVALRVPSSRNRFSRTSQSSNRQTFSARAWTAPRSRASPPLRATHGPCSN